MQEQSFIFFFLSISFSANLSDYYSNDRQYFSDLSITFASLRGLVEWNGDKPLKHNEVEL